MITLKSAVFGDVLLVIVGATGVGGIKETCVPGVEVKKGAELGYFYFGASSLVLIFKKEVVEVEKRFVKKSAKLLDWKDTLGKYGKGESVDYPESKVKMGQRVAIKKEPQNP